MNRYLKNMWSSNILFSKFLFENIIRIKISTTFLSPFLFLFSNILLLLYNIRFKKSNMNNNSHHDNWVIKSKWKLFSKLLHFHFILTKKFITKKWKKLYYNHLLFVHDILLRLRIENLYIILNVIYIEK